MKSRQTLLLSSLVACFCIGSARATTYYWTGASGTDTNYTNMANWTDGSSSPAIGDWEWQDFVFDSHATTGTVTLNERKGTGSLTLASGLAYDITMGGPQRLIMALGHGTPVATITIASDSKDLTVNADYDSQSPVTWDVGAGRTFTLNGGLLNFAGGTASIVKQGSGTAVLSGASTFSGTTDITAGTLVTANSTALGSGGFASGNMTNILDGATLALQGGISLDEHFHVWGAGVDNLGAVRSLSGDNALITTDGSGSAGYALRSNTTVGVDADTLTISGFYQQGGTYGVTKVGAGTLKFSAGSSYGGVTDIMAGTLLAANSTALGAGGLSGTTMTYIRDGATLALQGGVSLDEHFHAWGNGVGGLGTVRSLSGNNALTLVDGSGNGGLAIDTDITVGVDADTLTASGFYHDTGSFGITKNGNGSLLLTDKSRYTGNTIVSAGTLEVASTGSLRFAPSANGVTNAVSGSASATLSFAGTVSIDLTAADPTPTNSWNLFNLGSFTGPVPNLAPAAVSSTTLGSFNEVAPGVWELPVTGAKWVFTKSNGNLAYVTASTDYDTWKSANSVVGGENDDDDSDGLTNHEEYAFGLDPTGGSSVNPITIQLDKSTGTFSYTRRKVSLAGLTYSIWTSTDLVNWVQDSTAGQTATDILATENESVAVILTSPPTSAKFFIQVRAN